MELTTLKELVLREYQKPIVDEILSFDKVVLAAAPSAGKTEISIFVINEFLKQNPLKKVLVLPHSTTILKENFISRLNTYNVCFSYSDDLTDSSQVHITLPYSEENIIGKYDFIVIDEAHENTLAPRVQRIIKNSTPEKLLFLTGTPAIFIKEGGYHILPVPLIELPSEYFAKLNIETVASTYQFKGYYNDDLEINSSFTYNLEDTKNTLNSLFDAIFNRVNIGNWNEAYKHIGKTIIACNNETQAKQVYNTLLEYNVNSSLSTFTTDNKSNEFEKFQIDENINVLVVINRGRLGFNFIGLKNFIDLTGSRNPNTIYQMMCRVVRGTPKDEKFYIKVSSTDTDMMNLNQLAVNSALMLMGREWLTKFNGKNLNEMDIPYIKNSGGLSFHSDNTNIKVLLPSYTKDVVSILKSLNNELNKENTTYGVINIAEVRNILGDLLKKPNGYWTLERCKEEAKKYGTKSEWKSNSFSYQIALNNKWIDECCAHMEGSKPKGYWTLEKCLEEAKKYKRKIEWSENSPTSYGVALRNKWAKECCAHMIVCRVQKPQGYWTLEICKEEAKKYKTKSDWYKNNYPCYSVARRNKWIDECCAHMK